MYLLNDGMISKERFTYKMSDYNVRDIKYTLGRLGNLKQKNCRSIQYCCLLDKKCKREVDIPIKYVGFECEDKFVIGYGLDYDEKYRNLPYIGHVLNNSL